LQYEAESLWEGVKINFNRWDKIQAKASDELSEKAENLIQLH
jgi:hypothetical protein